MSTRPEELKRAFDRELNINDFRLVWEKAGVLSGRWDSVGILLGISYNKLYEIEAGGKPPRTCLQKVFDCWLKKDYDYKSHGVPTLRMLCNSIKSNSGGADPALADEIAKEFNLTSSGEATTSPVCTSSSKEATSTVKLPVPTSPQSESSVVYVKKKSIGYLPENLTRMLGDLREGYLDNMYFTEKSFGSIDVSKVIHFLQNYIALLLSPRFDKPQMIESIEKEFDHVQTMNQLFKALKRYVSWFNFELVVKLVNTFITDERDLQRKWSTYRQKLKDYFKNNNTKAVQIADSIEFGLSDVPGTKVMIAKVARDDYTLNDLYFFHKLIADALEVPQYKFYFCTIDDGCMELKYSIPDFLYSVLFPLTNQQCDSLAEIRIIKITCHKYVHEMKQLAENELKKLHDSPIDIHDPLWYENTSTPMNEACWRGLKDEVQKLIDKTGLQERGKNGWSPPLAASYGGHINVLCLLIDVYHCDPSQGDDDGVNSLHMASYKGHLNIAQYLVNECHVDPDIADSSGNTGLLYSALGGHVDLMIMFLKKKCNVSQVNREGSTLSLLGCKSGEVALVDQLKQFGIFSEDEIDFNGCGIVHYCAMSDSVELLVYLYNNHKNELFKKRNRFGSTPLHIACQYASSGLIMKMVNIFEYKVLLEADYSGHSSLHYLCSGLVDKYCITEVYNKLTAPCDIPLLKQFHYSNLNKAWFIFISLNINVTKQHKRVSLLSTLLKKTSVINNFNINSITATGQSLVHLACTSGSILLVKVLEEYGINTSSLDYEGQSAVHYAALSGSPTLLSYTVSEYRLNASQPDYKGVVPLALACMSGSINAVEYIMNTTDIDINITCNEGRTPLHYSCRHGNVDLSQYLIEVQDSDINITDNNKCNALGHSASSGNMKLVQYLINNHQLPLTSFALFQAVNSTKLSLIKLLVNEYKLGPQVKSVDRMQAVHCAAQAGAIDVLDLLHSTDDNDALPIHYACTSGVIQLVTFLIDVMKCDVTTEGKTGFTCVTQACLSGNLDLLKLLIKQYKLNLRIFGIASSPEAAVRNGHVHILEWLRQEYHINVASFKNGLLPFYAAQDNHLYCLKHLLNNYSFHVNATKPFYGTPSTLLHIACQEGHVAIVLYLTSLPQCDVSAKTSNGSTVLHLSCKCRSLPILKHLVEKHQLDLTIKDYNGMAPVHVACEEGSLSIV
uniref:Uncharacterized protein n=1 Tax=Amphimedon queenslandica TaxID=400682 RepID=A0A1X7TCD5_AMPQE